MEDRKSYSKKADYTDFDQVLEVVGSYGKYQKLVIFFVIIPALLPTGFYNFNIVFMAATPSRYWCYLPMDNITSEDLESLLPQEERAGKLSASRCHMFNLDYSAYTKEEIFALNNGSVDLEIIECQDGWFYDHSVFESTVVTDWDLICDREIYATLTFAFSTIGGVFGAFFWAFVADRYGRKPAYFSMIAFQITFATATAFAPNLIWFCVFRFCVGTATSFVYTLGLLMAISITGPKHRALMSVICSAGYTGTVFVFLGIAYFIRSWRNLALASSLPLLILFALWKFFPESPRWLLARGRYGELEEYLKKVARINKVDLDPQFERDLGKILRGLDGEDPESKSSILDLFRTPNLRKKTLVLSFVNFCNNGIFTGLNLYAPAFGGNPHLSAFLANLVELPPYVFGRYACDHAGRRLSLFYPMILCSLFCLVTSGLPADDAVSLLVVSLIAKFFITLTFLVAELYEEEIFPTVVRGRGHSVTSVISQFAGISAPFIVGLGNSYTILPLIIFGSASIIGAATGLLLPETAHRELPQTLEDGENVGKDMTWKQVFPLVPAKEKCDTPVELLGIYEIRLRDSSEAKMAS